MVPNSYYDDRWTTPRPVSPVERVHGPRGISTYLPPLSEVPPDFMREAGKGWLAVAEYWIDFGIAGNTHIEPKAGIDLPVAIDHLTAVLASVAPEPNRKLIGTAWLACLWFHAVRIKDGPSAPNPDPTTTP